MVGFDIPASIGSDSFIKTWKSNIGKNAIEFTERTGDGSFIKRFSNMSCTGKVEFSIGSDGSGSVEFKGDKVIG